jgi:hypothetical protein
VIPFPRPALPLDACQWCGLPPRSTGFPCCLSVREQIEADREQHAGGMRHVELPESRA